MNMERRQLLKTSLAFLGTTTLISFVYPASKFLVPPKSNAEDSQVSLDKDQIPPGTAKEVTYNDIPLVVINRKGSGFIALSRVCTHLGCLEFDLEGNVLSGPATKALQRYPLKISPNQITIG
jgi:cytochrome b6-f complex iron-sulfur subunit